MKFYTFFISIFCALSLQCTLIEEVVMQLEAEVSNHHEHSSQLSRSQEISKYVLDFNPSFFTTNESKELTHCIMKKVHKLCPPHISYFLNPSLNKPNSFFSFPQTTNTPQQAACYLALAYIICKNPQWLLSQKIPFVQNIAPDLNYVAIDPIRTGHKGGSLLFYAGLVFGCISSMPLCRYVCYPLLCMITQKT